MIDISTIKFIKILEHLQEMLNVEAIPFSRVTQDCENCLVYNDTEEIDKYGGHKIVLDKCVDEFHHDIICYADSYGRHVIRLYLNENDENYIVVYANEKQEYDSEKSRLFITKDGWFPEEMWS